MLIIQPLAVIKINWTTLVYLINRLDGSDLRPYCYDRPIRMKNLMINFDNPISN